MGGAGTYASLLARGLEKKGVDLFTISTGVKTTCEDRIYRVAIGSTTYWRRVFFSEMAMNVVSQLGRKCKFDLVHLNEPHVITKRPDLPVVCTFHSTQLHELELSIEGGGLKTAKSIMDLVLKNPVGHLCDIVTGYMSGKIICPSFDMIRLLKYCFVREKKIEVVPNGIDCKEFDIVNSDVTFLGRYGLEEGSFLLYVGRLHPLKGVQYLIDAFKKVKKRHEKLKLVIAGKGDFEPYLRKVASRRKDVIFLGHVASLEVKKTLYENCLAVVVPSVYETFPMVVLEAMACGKPIIATDAGGTRLLVVQGKSGILIKPKDVTGIETAIERLLEDSDMRRRMGMFGRKLVEEEYTVEKMVDRTLRVYNSLL
jgi:glycosyltransferase involved in cell wall biosynthesis